jgi:tetratricopeptide (TPR) repeat protein
MTAQFQIRSNIHYRMAHHYLNKLRAAEAAYQHGHEHSEYALSLFDQDWQNIKQWQAWSANHAVADHEAAWLCKEYSQASIDLLILRQHPQERLVWLNAGLTAARQLGDAQAEMIHEYLMGRVYNALGSPAAAQNHAEKALSLAQEQHDHLYMSKILITLGAAFYNIDDYEQAKLAYEQGLILSQKLDAKPIIGSALNGLGNVAHGQGNYEQAETYYFQYLEIAEIYGRPHDIALVLRNLALVKNSLGDIETAIAYAQQGAELARAVRDQRQLASILGLLGDMALVQGKLDEARQHYQESLDMARRTSRLSDEVSAWGRLGSLYLRLGDFTQALNCFESVLSLSNKSGFRWYNTLALLSISQVFRMMGDLGNASLKLREGLQIALTIENEAIHVSYLLEATSLGSVFGQLEQSAHWLGLLQFHSHNFDADQKNEFARLHQTLETKLGQKPFINAVAYGKTLSLDEVVRSLPDKLDFI